MSTDDLSGFSMRELFRVEVDNQSKVLTAGLLALESAEADPDRLEELMRAAHSLKGAARIVELGAAVRVAHVMEDFFVAAQHGRVVVDQAGIDLLLAGVDLLVAIAQEPEAQPGGPDGARDVGIDSFVDALKSRLEGGGEVAKAPGERLSVVAEAPLASAVPSTGQTTERPPAASSATVEPLQTDSSKRDSDRVLRVTAENLNRLLGLAGESLVESRWLSPFSESLLRLKRRHAEMTRMLDDLGEGLSAQHVDEATSALLHDLRGKVNECRHSLGERLVELEMYDRRSTHLSHRLYEQALACRMRPFRDGTHGFARMVRDLGHSLKKEVKLELAGELTDVDRDMLEKLEAPLTHLLRNAVDHGIETPEVRARLGKPSPGAVRLEARHNAGMLQIIVSDDGAGIDVEVLREAVIRRKLANPETAAKLSEAELFEFLFLPGFTMKEAVTEISGRGVGLDVVQNMIKQVRGAVRVSTQPGKGTRFQLQLPLALSVVRTLLVEVGGEPYAFPLVYITRTVKLSKSRMRSIEGRQYFEFEGRQIGLITVHQILERGDAHPAGEEIPVIIVGAVDSAHGIVVDRFLGEHELVVQPLDPRLGKIKDISAGALMEDGSPVLIVDVEDMIRSIDKLITGGRLAKVSGQAAGGAVKGLKRVLIVDDSLTVRELERKLLGGRGYDVDVAVDGMDGWNAVRTGHFDLVISDVDMPRMDGIELVTLIKKDPNTRDIPVMIVSYKDREEDRRRGLEAGADYYLAKGSFHDETLLHAVTDLIGEPTQ